MVMKSKEDNRNLYEPKKKKQKQIEEERLMKSIRELEAEILKLRKEKENDQEGKNFDRLKDAISEENKHLKKRIDTTK